MWHKILFNKSLKLLLTDVLSGYASLILVKVIFLAKNSSLKTSFVGPCRNSHPTIFQPKRVIDIEF